MGYPMFFLAHYLAIWSHFALDDLAKSAKYNAAELWWVSTRLDAVRAVVPAIKCSISRVCLSGLIRLFLIVQTIPHNRVI